MLIPLYRKLILKLLGVMIWVSSIVLLQNQLNGIVASKLKVGQGMTLLLGEEGMKRSSLIISVLAINSLIMLRYKWGVVITIAHYVSKYFVP